MSEVLAVLLRTNLALAGAVALIAMLRLPARRLFGARAAYGLWILAPIAALAVLIPPRTVTERASIEVGQAQWLHQAEAAARLDLASVVVGVWLAGAALFALHLALRQRRFLALAREGKAGPAAVGLIRPRMILPADFDARFTPDEARAVIAHETAHIRAQHPRINALVGAAQALLWFNPLVHLGVHLSRLDQEMACDEAAVAAAPALRRLYAETLLKTQLAATPLPLGCYWPARTQHPLTERIAMLARPLPTRARRLSAAALLSLIASGAGLAAWAAQPPARLAAPVGNAAPPAPASAPAPAEALAPPNPSARPAAETARPMRLADASPPVPPNVVTMPDWVERPQAADLVRFYPEAALRSAISGMARLECGVTADGRLENCTVTAETPTDVGFGQAAMQLAPLFQMRPTSRDGQPVAGGRVVIPIRFAVN